MITCAYCGKQVIARDRNQKYCSNTHSNAGAKRRKQAEYLRERYGHLPDPASLGWWCPPNIGVLGRHRFWDPEDLAWGRGFGPELPPQLINRKGFKLCIKYSEITSRRRIMSYSGFNKKVCYTKEEAQQRLAEAGEGEIYLCTYTSDKHWHYSRKGK